MAVSDSWIKVRGCLTRHPKVAAMTGHLLTDREFRMWLQPDEGSGIDGAGVSKPGRIAVTVGLLVAVWSAAREHGTFDGNDLVLTHNTLDDLDVLAGAPGVGRAMRAVGWADGSDDKEGVRLPDFKTYNVPRSDSERAAEYRLRKAANGTVTKSSRKTSRSRHDFPLSLSSVSPSESGSVLEGESERKPEAIRRTHSKAYTPQFVAAWKAYPGRGRESKPKAFAEWDRAVARVSAESEGMDLPAAAAFLMGKVGEFAASPKGRSDYVPAFHRWLKDDRWTDDKAVWDRGGDNPTSGVGKAQARQQAREAGQFPEEFGHVRTIVGGAAGSRSTPGPAGPAPLPAFD